MNRIARLSALLVLSLFVLAGAGSAFAYDVTIDFEGLPTTYYAEFGNQNLDGYFAPTTGVHFDPEAVILDSALGGLSDIDFPPHSGTAVLAPNSDFTDISFDHPAGFFEMWYTTSVDGTLDIYDDLGNLLVGGIGVGPNTGSSASLSVTDLVNNLGRIRFTSSAGHYTIDDVHVAGPDPAVPEHGSLLLLLTAAPMALRFRRRS